MQKQPKLGHFVPKMLEDWTRVHKTIGKMKNPTGTLTNSKEQLDLKEGELVKSIHMVIEMLQTGVCWTLSEKAFPFVWNTEISDVDWEGVRLPYNLMLIEYNFDLEVVSQQPYFMNEECPRRIIALVEAVDGSGFGIFSCYYIKDVDPRSEFAWTVSPVTIFFPYECMDKLDNFMRLSKNRMALDLGQPDGPLAMSSLPMYQELTYDEIEKHFVQEMVDELRVAFGLLAILNCDNAPTETIEAPAKLNKKRVKSGRPAIPTYRTLHVTDHTDRGSRGGATGEGTTKRTHWRRGHIRNQPTAKGYVRKWIKPTIINANAGEAKKPEVVIT